jgi:hypothetical protein
MLVIAEIANRDLGTAGEAEQWLRDATERGAWRACTSWV